MTQFHFFSLCKYSRAGLILLLCLEIGRLLSLAIEGLLPASILGMLLLTIGLTLGIIKLEWVEPGANLLLRWLSLLFVPISVALIEQWGLLSQYGLSILFILIVSTLIVICFAGFCWQWLEKR